MVCKAWSGSTCARRLQRDSRTVCAFRYVRQKNLDLSCASCALRYVRHKNLGRPVRAVGVVRYVGHTILKICVGQIPDVIHSIANGHMFPQFVRSGTFDRKILISLAHLVHCRTFRYVRQKNIDLSRASCALRYVRHKNIGYQCSLICFVVRSLEKLIRWSPLTCKKNRLQTRNEEQTRSTRWGSRSKPDELASRTRGDIKNLLFCFP